LFNTENSDAVSPWQLTPPLRYDQDNSCIWLLDQTLLPFEVKNLRLTDLEQCCEAISSMRTRGAPLIGLTAAWALVLSIRNSASARAIELARDKLLATRPSAVNLAWAVNQVATAALDAESSQRYEISVRVARVLEQQELDCCTRIAQHGADLLEPAAQAANAAGVAYTVLTHCNAGWLATGAWGTALAPIYALASRGFSLRVIVDETRPRNQGARLTAWELLTAGIDCRIIADSSAGYLMRRGDIDVCLVGSDRTTSCGDVCNKIGTYQNALAAADNNVPFYVALPTSTIDWTLRNGFSEIPIEERDEAELLQIEGIDDQGKRKQLRIGAPGARALNFAFDITPGRLVTGLICEHGLVAATETALAGLAATIGADAIG